MQLLDPAICYRALQTHDERFDGRLFVGVTSTGIYCRPVCPARPARLENCRFFCSAAAAAEAGFRPCLRCRPETAPDLGSWRGTSNTVSRGLALIAAGELDGEDATVERLAERVGVGGRQLRRLFLQHLGASPGTVAQTRRVLFAKRLIHDTRLPMAEIALASGFNSVRRFNETFQQLFHRAPSMLRRRGTVALPEGTVAGDGVTVRLRYRPPYDWAAMLAHLRGRALEGVERVDETSYRRTVLEDGVAGTVEVRHDPDRQSLQVTIRFPRVHALPVIIGRVRHLFDLGADVASIGAHLARDPLLAPLIAQRPGLRVPGGWDGFEIAARAILGQQVSVEAARKLVTQLVRLCGAAVPPGNGGDPTLHTAFPTAAQVAGQDLRTLTMPRARQQTLRALAAAAAADPLLFQPAATLDQTTARLRALHGIGDWTANYIALRAGREPDAFPATDVGLLRGAAVRVGRKIPATALQARAASWRPWRGYAAQHLWAADAASRSTVKGDPRP
jgi:AraC family transcriptional regulator of adaptative response / DNA-3-methyladenine glycosylase II